MCPVMLRLKRLIKSSSVLSVNAILDTVRKGTSTAISFCIITLLCNLTMYLRSQIRFRIVVLADDTTLVTNVILFDRVVKRMGATTVANILNLMKKVSTF